MAKYVYPAIFTKDPEGYSVIFPDLEGCYTCGEDLAEALNMAEDALALYLFHLEDAKKEIPSASSLEEVRFLDGSFANYIKCDTLGYRKRYNTKSVRKTLSIPEWLNEVALANNANFSQVLQDALIEKYHV